METRNIKTQLSKHIKDKMGSNNPRYSLWYCGITNNEKRRRIEHGDRKGLVDHWKCYRAKNSKDANEIEAYFSTKGTSNYPESRGAIENSIWVYIFKRPSKRPEGLNGIFSSKNLLDQLFTD